MQKKHSKYALIAIGALLICAMVAMCSSAPSKVAQSTGYMPTSQSVQAAPAYQQQPVVIQQAAAPAPAHSSTGDLLTGAAVGALAMNAMSNSQRHVAPPAPRVVHRTTVVNKTVYVPAPRPSHRYTASRVPTSNYRKTTVRLSKR